MDNPEWRLDIVLRPLVYSPNETGGMPMSEPLLLTPGWSAQIAVIGASATLTINNASEFNSAAVLVYCATYAEKPPPYSYPGFPKGSIVYDVDPGKTKDAPVPCSAAVNVMNITAVNKGANVEIALKGSG